MPNRLLRVLACVAAGTLVSFAFAPWSQWWTLPLGLALTFEICTHDPRRAYQYVFLAALVLEIVHLHWTSIYVGSIPWVLLALCEALFFTLPFLFWKSGSRLGFLASWLVGEWLIARAPYEGFGWSRIGFIGNGPTLDVAYLGGPTLIAVTNILAAFILQKIYLVLRQGDHAAGFSTAVLLIHFLWIVSISPVMPQNFGRAITISGVQGNVPRLGLDFNAQREAVLQNHVDLTLTNRDLRKSDLVVWPENASDVDPLVGRARTLIEGTATSIGVPIILGGVTRSAGPGLRNISLMVTPGYGIDAGTIYTKRHLAPFGEYLPLRGVAEQIAPSAVRIEDMTPGTSEVVYQVGAVAISPVICFEVLDDQLLTEKSLRSQVFAVLTNSATFGRTPQSREQLAISRVRSIEHGRPIISISTSGVSAFIDAQGRTSQETKIFQPAVITSTVMAQSRRTPSDAFPGGSANVLPGLGLLLAIWRRFHIRRWN
jgi:apolipoprotein N-acyltransferase